MILEMMAYTALQDKKVYEQYMSRKKPYKMYTKLLCCVDDLSFLASCMTKILLLDYAMVQISKKKLSNLFAFKLLELLKILRID